MIFDAWPLLELLPAVQRVFCRRCSCVNSVARTPSSISSLNDADEEYREHLHSILLGYTRALQAGVWSVDKLEGSLQGPLTLLLGIWASPDVASIGIALLDACIHVCEA
jgi:hypothetical protein